MSDGSPWDLNGAESLDGADLDGAPGRDQAGEDAGDDEDREGRQRAFERHLGVAEHLGGGIGDRAVDDLDHPDPGDEPQVSGQTW